MKRILRIRWQTLGPSLLGIAVLVMLSGWIGTRRMMSHFQGLERTQVIRSQTQAEQSLERRLDNLRVHGLDWSQWDDAATWLAGKDPNFPASNLNQGSLTTLDLDALFYWDTTPRRIDGLRTDEAQPIDRRLDDLVRKIRSQHEGWTGIVRADTVLFACTVQPVVPSSGQGPSRGWLVMAQRFDPRVDSALSLQLQMPTRILAQGDTVGVSSWGDADSGVLAWKVPVLEGEPGIMEIRLDRPMLVVGRDASRQFLLLLLVGLGVVVVLSLAILERFVLSRIARLADSVSRIRHEVGEVVDVVDPRDDELGNLSRRIQVMVDNAVVSRKRLEAALDLAESSSRARMSFLQSMTHELRTPLNGVIGLTDLVLKGDLEPQVQEALELSRSAALGLLETINGVLEYSRLEKGEVELVLAETDVVDVILDAARTLGFEAERKGLDFVFLASPKVPSKFLVDAARLRRIFVNLAGNAVKYTQSGKIVVTVSFDDAVGALGISVRDTGIGIAADRLEAIFQPFVQADEESAVRFGGTGLGLAVAQTLARSMQSLVHVRSTPGVGSEFWFSVVLPVLAAPEEIPRPQGIVQWDLSRPELDVFLRSAVGSEGRGKGILVTDSLEKAISVPQRSVVLCKTSDLRRVKTLIDDGRSEIVVSPFLVEEISRAVIRCERADATIAILASGRILVGMLVGILEGGGYRTLVVESTDEVAKLLAYGIPSAVVADHDDPKWRRTLVDSPVPVVWIGDPQEESDVPVLSKPVRKERLFAELARLLGQTGS